MLHWGLTGLKVVGLPPLTRRQKRELAKKNAGPEEIRKEREINLILFAGKILAKIEKSRRKRRRKKIITASGFAQEVLRVQADVIRKKGKNSLRRRSRS